MKKILLYSRDPGAANVIIPIYSELLKSSYVVKLLGKDAAISKYKLFNIYNYTNVSNSTEDTSVDYWINYLKDHKFDFVITGTGSEEYSDKYLWKACEHVGIPSLAILDQWMNYGVRFSKYHATQLHLYENDNEHIFQPSYIFVMDSETKEEMVRIGFDEKKIIVTGQPYLDFLNRFKSTIDYNNILHYKEKINCLNEDLVIVFASENITKTEVDFNNGYIGYTDKSIIEELILAIQKNNRKYNKKIKIIIRRHPNEHIDVYSDIISNFGDEHVNIEIDNESNLFELILAGDCIVGMSSMLLIEASLLGKYIMSIQIGISKENPFVLHQKGLLQSITSRKELEEQIDLVLNNQYFKGANVTGHIDAIERVINKLEELL
ncbi:hypothetical protein BHU72_05235 [Desulfuribacillus stibiiarsenatis]|uniref:UDP-N-acetylglucosamine 2-epimerase domain-containing protein n=1 Tax=Desulfuribacillus stibiiarsenatis TaxID=1390249 RepID=A0A1E5L5U3_9FIRM|nr:hypothetical protein [Desulfuribacillus stibiiarsenatis]OEH85491.1 hypothetical protein BHU72_05235 [Desulfuribacillus stibiiarsenatis]